MSARTLSIALVVFAFAERTTFAQAAAGAPPRQALDVTLGVAEAYDDDLRTESGVTSAPTYQVSGFYTSFTPQVDFKSNGSRFQFAATGGSSIRYFREASQRLVMTHHAGAGFGAQFTRRTSMSFNQGVTYSPSYFYGLFPSVVPPEAGDVVPPATDYSVDSTKSYAYATAISVEHRLTPRATLSATANYRYTDVIYSGPLYSDLRSQDAGGRFTYLLNRGVSLRLGYTYRATQLSQLVQPTEHSIDVGVEYSRQLSRTRRSTIKFSVAPLVMNGAAFTSAGASNTFRMTGDLSFNHQMSRTWNAQGGYRRGLAYIEGLQGPAYTDGFTATVGGFLNQRTDLLLTAAGSTGRMATLAAAPFPFMTYTGDVRLQVAVTKTLATYVEYLYYYYDFSRAILLPFGMPHRLTRNGVRAGLTLRIPVRHR